MRKPQRDVELDDIISSQIIGDDSEVIALVMKIHLALEAIIIDGIRTFDTDDKIYKLSFPAKAARLVTAGLATDRDRQAFEAFNDFRNDFAHIFGHRVTLGEVLALARKLEALGVDFSDSVGQQTEEEASEGYGGLVGVLEEIGWCILFHAASMLSKAGGRDLMASAS
jgi:hypothetical protein